MERWKNWWTVLRVPLISKSVSALALLFIALYRASFSRWTGPVCRFEPSCSCYATEAFRNHSPIRASWLTLRRLLKCHPMGPFGYDPVPPNPRSN